MVEGKFPRKITPAEEEKSHAEVLRRKVNLTKSATPIRKKP
jgi:hypothetical protein